MKLTVEAVDNGYIIEHASEYADGTPTVTRMVFQNDYPLEKYESDESAQESEAMAAALRYIDSQMGPSTSRYSKARVYVRVEPGDKYVSEDEEKEDEEMQEVLDKIHDLDEPPPENVSF